MNINELIKQEAGTKPASITGVVQSVGKINRFSGGHVQTVTLKDRHGDSIITAKLWNRDPLTSSDIGCVLEWTGGLTLKEDEYNGKKRIFLNITERAEQSRISTDDDEIPMTDEPPKATENRDVTWVDVGHRLELLGALYSACYAQACVKLANEIEKRTGRKLGEEDIRQVATTLFIQSVGRPIPATVWARYGEPARHPAAESQRSVGAPAKSAPPPVAPPPVAPTQEPTVGPTFELPDVPF